MLPVEREAVIVYYAAKAGAPLRDRFFQKDLVLALERIPLALILQTIPLISKSPGN